MCGGTPTRRVPLQVAASNGGLRNDPGLGHGGTVAESTPLSATAPPGPVLGNPSGYRKTGPGPISRVLKGPIVVPYARFGMGFILGIY